MTKHKYTLEHEPEKCESSDRWKKGDESGLVEPRAFLRRKARINLWSELFWDQFLVRAVLGSIFGQSHFGVNLLLARFWTKSGSYFPKGCHAWVGMIHNNRKVGVAQEVNWKAKKCTKPHVYDCTYRKERMENKGSSCPLHVISNKPKKWWNVQMNIDHLGNKIWATWFLHFLTSLQKIEMLLD